MNKYISGDEEYACPCNYHSQPVIVDADKMILKCSICGHTEKLPSYMMLETHSEQLEHYYNPLKKIYG